jgi:uncharacterized membrane protein
VLPSNQRHRALAHRWVLAGLLLLAASSVAAVLVSWSGTPSALLALVLIPPLLAPLRGIVRGDRRTHAWATLCVVPGFVYGITEAVANPGLRPLAALVLASSFVFFFALVAYLRVTRPPPANQPPPTP